MSNLKTQLNNINYRISQIANEGLTNPLQQILNANNYQIQNVNVIDAGANVMELKSANVGGIQTDCNLTVGLNGSGNITCNTLTYQELDPPLIGTITYATTGTCTQPSYSNFDIPTGTGRSYSQQTVSNPNLSCYIRYIGGLGNLNATNIGFVSNNTQNTLTNGILIYQNSAIYSVQNGTNIASIPFSVVNPNGGLSINLKSVNGVMKVFINNVYYPILSTTNMIDGNYYFWQNTYAPTAEMMISVNNFSPNQFETLAEVLDNGNDSLGQSIVGLGGLTMSNNNSDINLNNSDLTNCNNAYVNVLHYGSLQPPVGPSGTANLEDVLQNGNNANNETIENLGGLTMTGDINLNFNNLDNVPNLLLGITGGVGHLYLGSTANNYDLYCDGNNNFILGQNKNNAFYNDPITIADNSFLRLKTTKLLYNTPTTGSTGSYILDCYYTPPMYKQIINSANGIKYDFSNIPKSFFSYQYYDNSNYDLMQYRGMSYLELTFTYLILTFQIVTTNPSPEFWTEDDYCTIYVSGSLNSAYDNTKANCIVVPMQIGKSQTIFTSSIPIILGCTTVSQNNNKLYLNCVFSRDPLSFGPNTTGFSVNMTTTNFIVSGSVSQNPNSLIQIIDN